MMRMLFLLSWIFLSSATQAQEVIPIIPQPAKIRATGQAFILDQDVYLNVPKNNLELRRVAEFLSRQIQKVSGIQVGYLKKRKAIVFNLVPTPGGREGYQLLVKENAIILNANSSAGLFYGVQSLIQTLPPIRTNQLLSIPGMEIADAPRFGWRGFMLDVSRHFYSVEAIKEMLDLMALFKLNVFHWHLTDDQGWRLEIKKYPKLTSVGAWRSEKKGAIFYEKDTTHLQQVPSYVYGGYYTQEQAREIVAYASSRHITVVPEIEMPGHSGAAISAYPQFSCRGESQPVPNIAASSNFDNYHSNYCAGNPQTFSFLQEVLQEVMQIFPSMYLHIGGDEVDKKDWKACPKCQALMKQQRLTTEEQLQSYFIRTMEKFIVSKGRKLLGWGEILEGGLAPEATVMSWIGEKRGIEAAKSGHDVVMAPSNPLYLNRHQTDSFQYEPRAAKFSINTLQKVYDYNPVPQSLTPMEAKHILGTQAVIWTEFIPSVNHLEYMLLPRLLALSEGAWTPLEKKNYPDFTKRLSVHLNHFDALGIRYFNKELD